jgi:hypothetical protein
MGAAQHFHFIQDFQVLIYPMEHRAADGFRGARKD